MSAKSKQTVLDKCKSIKPMIASKNLQKEEQVELYKKIVSNP